MLALKAYLNNLRPWNESFDFHDKWNIYQLLLFIQMEKISWKPVRHNDRSGSIPSLRWGHSCCIIDDEVVFFGGYADSSYMNDVWSFNTITMEWREVITSGDIPSHRSNCSMCYDSINKRIVVFGGGGANKRRFNSLNMLDWATKEWMEIVPKPNEPSPWERTYHTAELYYPYLVVFGGEGLADLDDLWAFNFETLSWTQLHTNKTGPRPSARRFHSSVRLGNEFYVIAGCYSKYRCLSDIYSIDLTSFFQTGSPKGLTWKERRMKESTFLTRWGHTSAVYEDKIYVYGGRFCNDLSDILMLDPERNTITSLKVCGQAPKARRRHSACFLGSSMLIFGGFNGEYFNDLHYINIHSTRRKVLPASPITQQDIAELSNISSINFTEIATCKKEIIRAYPQLLRVRFQSTTQMNRFLAGIQGVYTLDQLNELLLVLYKGYGVLEKQLVDSYRITIFQSKQDKDSEQRRLITLQEIGTIGKKRRAVDPVIYLEDDLYSEFLSSRREETNENDIIFNINNEALLRINRPRVALSSKYFANLISGNYEEKADGIYIPLSGSLLFETLLNFLATGFVVVHKDVDYKFWVKLTELAEYFSLEQLLFICEWQLIGKIDEGCCQELLVIGLDLNLNQLAMACGQQIIKSMVNQDLEEYNDVFPEIGCEMLGLRREKVLKDVYSLLRFDILQKKIDLEYQDVKNSAKTIESQGDREEKENFQAIS